MFQLVVLSALIACGTAAPSGIHGVDQYSYAGPVSSYAAATGPVLVEQHVPAVAKVAEYVEHVPSSVSHHSSAVVHSSAAVATPVITPVAKTTVVSAPAPILHSTQFVAAPARTIVEAAPIVEEIRETQYVAPVVHQQEYAKVAEVVEHVPSSVSHHSSSIVHSSAAVATPVITPVTKTTVVSAPAPILHSAPARTIVEAAPAPIFHSAPARTIVEAAPAPILHSAPARTIVEHAPIVEEIRETQYVAPVVHQQEYAKVAEVVEHVPSSVSHHSSSVVHNTAAVATPVITPVAKTVVSTAPVYRSAPLLNTVHTSNAYAYAAHAPAAYAAHAPAVYAAHAPATYATHGAATYATHGAAAYAVHEAPLYNALPYASYNYGPAVYNGPLLRAH